MLRGAAAAAHAAAATAGRRRRARACAARCGEAGAASSGAPRRWCCRCSRSSSCASWRRSARCWRAGSSTPTSRAFSRASPRRSSTGTAATCRRRTRSPRWCGDIHAARDAGTLASAATRLNYDVPGFRTLLFGTGRQLPEGNIGIRARHADRHRSEMGENARPGSRFAAPAVPSPISICSAHSTFDRERRQC